MAISDHPPFQVSSGCTGYGALLPPSAYEQLTLFAEGVDISDDQDDLEVFEQIVVEKSYDENGNVVKETRTVLRPKHRDLEPRTPMPKPRDKPPLVPPPQPVPYYPVYVGDSFPMPNQVWCVDHSHTRNLSHTHDLPPQYQRFP